MRPKRTDGPKATNDNKPPEAPRTLGQLRALLATALSIVERKAPIAGRARRDLAVLLRAALRYKRPA